jgi:hypothetical protein
MSYDQYREDVEYEFEARYDYISEAYGDRCPNHPGVLRGGGDCHLCEAALYDPDPLAEDYPGQHITGPDYDTRDHEGREEQVAYDDEQEQQAKFDDAIDRKRDEQFDDDIPF